MTPETGAELAALQEQARRLDPDNPLHLFKVPGIMWRFSRICFREAARQRRAKRRS